jgi:hypothetical protein
MLLLYPVKTFFFTTLLIFLREPVASDEDEVGDPINRNMEFRYQGSPLIRSKCVFWPNREKTDPAF